jgi:putative transposase
MPRPLRSNQCHGTYYVVLVTNGNQALFQDEQDRIAFEEILENALGASDAQVLAYRWTEQDARLVVKVRDVPLAAVMRRLSGPYARVYNGRHARTGALFGERYRSEMVCGDSDLLQVVRRMHRHNTPDCEHGTGGYSSHLTYLGAETTRWVSTGIVFRLLAATAANGGRAYKGFMSERVRPQAMEISDDIPDAFPIVKGDVPFVRWLRARAVVHARTRSSQASLDDIIEAAARMINVDPQEIVSSSRARRLALARALVAWHATRNGVASVAEVTTRLARDPSSLYAAHERYRKLLPSLFNQPLKVVLKAKRHRGGAYDAAALRSGVTDAQSDGADSQNVPNSNHDVGEGAR